MTVLNRLIRYRDAPGYLGMDRNRFDVEVRPSLTEIPIGERGIAFDRIDLDAWADDYKARNGRPSRKKGVMQQCERGQKASKSPTMAAKLSINNIEGGGFSPDSGPSAKTKRKLGSGKSKTGSMSNLSKAIDACSAMQQKSTY